MPFKFERRTVSVQRTQERMLKYRKRVQKERSQRSDGNDCRRSKLEVGDDDDLCLCSGLGLDTKYCEPDLIPSELKRRLPAFNLNGRTYVEAAMISPRPQPDS